MLMTDASNTVMAESAGRSRIAVLVPCYNEEAAIAKVVADFRAALPDAAIYVYDNNSTDRTVEAATTTASTGSTSSTSSTDGGSSVRTGRKAAAVRQLIAEHVLAALQDVAWHK